MCKAFSGLVFESGDVFWKFTVDGHEVLRELYGKKMGRKCDDFGLPREWARFEITPANGNYLNPDKWAFKLDEEKPPSWWSRIHEDECWKAHKEWIKKLDKILVRKSILYPFKDVVAGRVRDKEKELLKKWASVWASVRDSVRASVRDSVWGYVGSFFRLPRKSWKYTKKIKTSGYPFQPAVDLWMRGFVPSFGGTTWKLHAGKDAKVVYKWTPRKKRSI